jgi:Flp pilus assembly protein TadD
LSFKAALILLAAASPARPQAASAFDRAVALQRAGDLAGARTAYEELLKAEPGRVDAQANLGSLYLRLNHPAEAVRMFEAASQRMPAHREIRFLLALSRFQTGDTEGARDGLAPLLAPPADTRALYLEGMCLLRQEKVREAIPALEKAAELAPANPEVQLTLVTTYVSLRQLDKAAALIDGPLAGFPAAAKLVNGMILNLAGKHTDARRTLEEAVKENPRLATLRNQLGYTFMLLGDAERAIREFEEELKINPRDFHAQANLGWVLVQERDFSRAGPMLEQALAMRPGNAGLLYLMAQVWMARGDWGKAAPLLEKATEIQPAFRAANVLLARVYSRQGKQAEAMALREKIARLEHEEQERNIQSRDGYGAGTAKPALDSLTGSTP